MAFTEVANVTHRERASDCQRVNEERSNEILIDAPFWVKEDIDKKGVSMETTADRGE